MWVKGSVRWEGKQVLHDSTKWHHICECDGGTLYIDGKLRYELYADMTKNKLMIRKIGDKK